MSKFLINLGYAFECVGGASAIALFLTLVATIAVWSFDLQATLGDFAIFYCGAVMLTSVLMLGFSVLLRLWPYQSNRGGYSHE